MSADPVLVVFHSQSGTAAALARAAYAGACAEDGPGAELRRCVDAGVGDLLRASGLLLVCAENSGRLAGGAKDFLDRVFYPLIAQRCTLPYALLVSAGNDGRNAVEEAQRIFRGIPFTPALEPRIIRGLPQPSDLTDVRDMGAGFAVGLSMGIF